MRLLLAIFILLIGTSVFASIDGMTDKNHEPDTYLCAVKFKLKGRLFMGRGSFYETNTAKDCYCLVASLIEAKTKKVTQVGLGLIKMPRYNDHVNMGYIGYDNFEPSEIFMRCDY